MSIATGSSVYRLALALVAAMLLPATAQSAAIVVEHRFEKLEAGVAPDQQGHWPAKATGEVRLAEGRRGQSLALDGKGYLTIPGTEKLTVAHGFSIEAWICPDRLAAGRIFDAATPATSDSFCLDTHPGDGIRLITPAGSIQASKALTAGRWVHVLAVYDAEGGELAMYLDGKLAVAQPVGAMKIAAAHPIHIGADPNGDNRFVGRIDEVRLYDFALTDDAAAARFAGQEPPGPAAEEQAPVHYRDGLAADHARLLARNDVVYLSPALHEHEAMPVGNGRLCGMVWNADGLNVQINHVDNLWHQSSSGRVRLGLPLPAQGGRAILPVDEGKTDRIVRPTEGGFTQRLCLYDAAVRTDCRTAAGAWSATTRALTEDVIAIHLEGQLPTPLTFEVEQWRPTARAVVDQGRVGFVEDLPAPTAPEYARRMALLIEADCPAVPQPAKPEGDRRVLALTLSPPRDAQGKARLTLYVANPVVAADGDPRAVAAGLLSAALGEGWEKSSVRTADRWRQFWAQSLVNLHSPDGRADYMENLWRLHLYWMGCGGAGQRAVKFNGGPFLVHRDSRSWGTSYWYQNTREPYWCLPAANHLPLCEGLQRLYLATVPAHRRLAQELFGKRGLQIEETMTLAGPGDKRGNTYTMLYLSTGLECSLQLYHQAAFARDDRLLAEVLPLMKEAVDFYIDYATLGPDGRYRISPEDGRETYWRVQDSMTSIAALREAIPILVRESERLGLFADMRPKWTAWLDRLAPLPLRADGLAYAPCVVPPQIPASDNATVNRLYPPDKTSTAIDKRFNGENVELDVLYPFGHAGIGTANFEMAKRTYFDRTFKGSYGWDWTAVCAARLGLGEEAARVQAEHCRGTQHWPQGFWDSPAGAYWAGGLVDCPYFDSPGVNAAATSEMLLQSHDGRIRVWPAVPENWSGTFRLRAETGFMVVSERGGGVVRYVAVESLFGGACRLVNPWNAAVRVTQAGRPVLQTADADIRFPTEQGKTYLVEPADRPLAQLAFAPLAPEPNPGPKFMARPRRGTALPTPQPGLPMLGITADGLTGPRAAAADNRARAEKAIQSVVGGDVRTAGVHVRALDPQDAVSDASWLTDRRFGAANIPYATPPAGYQIEVPIARTKCVLVWSGDRTGGRQDGLGSASQCAVETSADGQTWTAGVKQPLQHHDQHGHALRVASEKPFRHIRLRFLAADGSPRSVACDEIETY